MRIKSKPRTDIDNWHNWYAWFPVKLGSGDWVWLETVDRKRELAYEPFYIYEVVR